MHWMANGNKKKKKKPFFKHQEQDKTTCFGHFHNFILEVLARSIRLDKEIKTSNLEMNKEKLSIFTDEILKNRQKQNKKIY